MHPQMDKTIEDAKIAILRCPFEPPKPKTKHKIDIDTAEKYEELPRRRRSTSRIWYLQSQGRGADASFASAIFDDEANHS